MARRWMRNGWLLAAALLALALPTTSWAIPGNLQFYENSAGQGNTLEEMGPFTDLEPLGLNLRYNASSADSATELGNPDGLGTRAGIFDFDIIITTTGNVVLDAFDCMATDCSPILTLGGLPVPAHGDSLRVQGGDDLNGEEGVQILGLLKISGTNGSVVVQGGPPGGYTPFSFARHEFQTFTLASVVVPEPGTFMLLGMGLGALAVLRRRSR